MTYRPEQAVPSYAIDLATPRDDDDLRAVLAATPMPGPVAVACCREPSYFGAAGVDGRFRQTLVARCTATNRIVAMSSRSVMTRYVNGQPSDIGYLGALRILPRHRGRFLLARGYAFLHDLHHDGRALLYLTTIAEGNATALSLLTSGRAGLPAYHPAGRYHTAAIPLTARGPAPRPSTHLEIRPACHADVPRITAFLSRLGPTRQFFPCYQADDFFTDSGLLRGLRPDDLLLAFRHGQLVGTCGAWDQHSFRQHVVTGYHGWMRLLRPWCNIAASARRRPRLPAVGQPLRCLMAALPVAEDPDILAALLAATLARRRAGPWDYLMIGLAEDDPAANALRNYPGRRYTTRPFLACWPDGEALRSSLDRRPIYLELGAL